MTRLMLVDDDATFLSGLAALLSMSGYSVTALPSGQAALDTMQDDPPEVLITDILMPGMSGVALMHAVYARAEWRNIPIIFISAGRAPDLDLNAMESVSFIPKPFDIQELEEAIRQAVAIRARTVA